MSTFIHIFSLLLCLISLNLNAANVIGLLKGKEEVLIKSKSQGELVEILIKEGQTVKKGDVVARLDDKKETVELQLAQAEHDAAKTDFESSQKLKKFISKEELTKKKNTYLRKESAFKLKEIALKAKHFISPINGIVARRYIKKGESVSSGEKSFEIINMKELVINLDILAPKAQKLKLEDSVVFQTELHPGKTFKASIYHIGPVLDKASGTVNVKAELANMPLENGSYFFRPGTMIRVILE
jgi:membrane fusion protein, multidrug efflux system